MRTKGLTNTYVIPELSIKLCAPDGAAVDTAIAYDVGVTVEYDYDYADEDDAAQAHIRSVKSAGAALDGAALDGERTTVNFWAGCDIKPYLVEADIDAIAEAMVKHMAAVLADENEAMRLHIAGI